VIKKPFFSVIVPIYNVDNYLIQTIESVIYQSFQTWELILIDDGSADSSYQIAYNWTLKDKRIKLLQHKKAANRGVSASRNLGIQHARGKWVAFLDADDVWLPNKLQNQYEVIQKYNNKNLVLVYSQATVIDEKGSFIKDKKEAKMHNPLHALYGSGKPGFQENAFKWTIQGGFDAPTSTVVCKRELIDELGGFEEDMHFSEDALMWYRMIEKGDMYFMDEALCHYRVHQKQWNAAATAKLKSTRRFIAYERLLDLTDKIYLPYISSLLVQKGFKIIVRTNIGYPHFDWKLIFNFWIRLLKIRQEKLTDKLSSPVIFLSELLILPVRLIYSWIK
jgi:glycosyltransferase involved in cell wall biosynthesis